MSEESVLDVAAQVRVKRPVYSAPQTWAKKVNVKPGETSDVSFAITAK
jgi:hypothetical protein